MKLRKDMISENIFMTKIHNFEYILKERYIYSIVHVSLPKVSQSFLVLLTSPWLVSLAAAMEVMDEVFLPSIRTSHESRFDSIHESDEERKKIILGVCVMDKKVTSYDHLQQSTTTCIKTSY